MKRLFSNATFVTMVDDVDTADALLVDDDGRLAEGAEEVDLGGAAVLPGLIDPHSHFTGALQYLLYADLSECTSFAEITETLKKFAAERNIGPDGVIMGNGYDQNNLIEQRHPDKSILNAVSEDVPVLITHVSNHMGVANDCLLKLAGITPTTPDPEGGRYGRMNGTGDLDGYAEEPAAMNPFYAVTTPRLGLDFAAMVPDMQRIYLEHGVTTCQDGATAPDMAKVLVGLARAGLLKMDIVSYPMWGSDVMATLADNAEFDSQSYTGHFRFGGLKMFLDGSPQGLTAWMTEPYVEGPDGEKDWVAYSTMTDEDAIAFAKMAIDSNHQLLCHCNGDAAADQLLRVYEAARDASDNPEKMALRPVMIHAQLLRQQQTQEGHQIAQRHQYPRLLHAQFQHQRHRHRQHQCPGQVKAQAVRRLLRSVHHRDHHGAKRAQRQPRQQRRGVPAQHQLRARHRHRHRPAVPLRPLVIAQRHHRQHDDVYHAQRAEKHPASHRHAQHQPHQQHQPHRLCLLPQAQQVLQDKRLHFRSPLR